jgi:catechol 2,3-dioxygenase-like lactoylglutathione lyase family enzyme
MKILLTSVMVDDPERAFAFYKDVLGFVVKIEIDMGEFTWQTLVSPEQPDGVELLLEPNFNPVLNGAAQAFQRALVEAGIPATAFAVDDIQQEYARLRALGVEFTSEPTDAGPVIAAVFNDTVGNLIQIYQVA